MWLVVRADVCLMTERRLVCQVPRSAVTLTVTSYRSSFQCTTNIFITSDWWRHGLSICIAASANNINTYLTLPLPLERTFSPQQPFLPQQGCQIQLYALRKEIQTLLVRQRCSSSRLTDRFAEVYCFHLQGWNKVVTAVRMTMFFRVLTPCGLVCTNVSQKFTQRYIYRRFAEVYCSHLQGWNKVVTAVSMTFLLGFDTVWTRMYRFAEIYCLHRHS
jgi:hypothetical protein